MGGNAIKVNGKSITGRLSAKAYKKVHAFVLDTLKPHVETAECVIEAPGKTSFGDLDVLYVPSSPKKMKKHAAGHSELNLKDVVFNAFNLEHVSHVVRQGPVLSFALPKATFEPIVAAESGSCGELPDYFQVDLIRVSDNDHLASSRFYFAYSDVGSILGRIFNYYGLKFGEAGVWCEVFQQTVDAFEEAKQTQSQKDSLLECTHKDLTQATIGKLMLTKDPREICAFAGLDHDAFFNNMHTVEDVHKWITTSHLFKKEIFLSLKHKNRRRALERPTYIKFLKHIGIDQHAASVGADEKDAQAACCPISVIDSVATHLHTIQRSSEIKCNMQLEAIKHFNVEAEFINMVKNSAIKRERQAKFSGSMLINGFQNRDEAHGGPKKISGKEVATQLAAFKKHCCTSVLDDKAVHEKALGADSNNQLEPLFEQYLDAFDATEIKRHLKLWIDGHHSGILHKQGEMAAKEAMKTTTQKERVDFK